MAEILCDNNCIEFCVSFDNFCYDKLHQLYAENLLPDVRTCDIESGLVKYITSVIEPVGWKAIWKIRKHPVVNTEIPVISSLIVEVCDVSLHKLQATVKVLEVLINTSKDLIGNSDGIPTPIGEVLLGQEDVEVPLIQLYPIKNYDISIEKSAVAIHNVRFFYAHIWRPWDDELNGDEDAIFVEKHLSSRLNFYLELRDGLLPEKVGYRYREILVEGFELKEKLLKLQNQMQSSDSDEELNPEDVTNCMQLLLMLESLRREMETLENPLLRILQMKTDTTAKAIHSVEPTTHIVAEKVTYGMLKSLELDDHIVVEQHCTIENAISAAESGDTILIFPGHYKTGPIPWIEEDITIKGVGEKGQVVLEASSDCGELLLSCNTQNLHILNLEFVSLSDMLSTVMVHEGSLKMDHCTLKGPSAHSLLVLAGGKAHLSHCTITNNQDDGIQLRAGSTMNLDSCSVVQCQGSALKLDAPIKVPYQVTSLDICDSSFCDNGKFAIVADCMQELDIPEDGTTWESLSR